MNNSAVFKNLLDHVLMIDFSRTDIDALFESMQPYLEKLTDKLYVAKALGFDENTSNFLI